jgi:magnesium chelatase subunit D
VTPDAGPSPAADAARAAQLLALDPAGLGGAVLRAAPGPVRDAWLKLLKASLPEAAPWRRLPLGAPDSRLLGGLDLAATLAAGRPVAERGVLADAHGGVVLLAMAERLPPETAARLSAALDAGEVAVQRDGLSLTFPARVGIVALDEGITPEEATPPALRERLAFHLQPDALEAPPQADLGDARDRLKTVTQEDAVLEALCGAALALGVDSLRAPLMALRAARAAAALDRRDSVNKDDVALAARLVLGPRATRLPAEEQPEQEQPQDQPPPDEPQNQDQPDSLPDAQALQEMAIAAARAALPAGLMETLKLRDAARRAAGMQGKAGQRRKATQRGRPIGTKAGTLGQGARLALVETLRVAAPWQRLRRAARPDGPRIRIARDDIRLRRFQQNTATTVIFAVDASGSAALHRLGEAKGAVELLLGECYARRDQVALVAFRGSAADLILPPTSSLVRAKRSLAGLPGGGATPLASGLDAAGVLAAEQARRGRTPILVVLTDGRANIARDGSAGRPQAEADGLAAATALREAGLTGLVVDTAPRPTPYGRKLAEAMGARYLALPTAQSEKLSGAVAAVRAAG